MIISLFLTLLTAEALARAFSIDKPYFSKLASSKAWSLPPEWEGGLPDELFRHSPSLGYELGKNSRLGTNSLGMMDKERTAEKPKDTFRIICVGDSTTASSEYTQVLEGLLNEGNCQRKFEVWNSGVPGYCLTQYCRAIQEKWIKFDPDLIIIGFSLTDFDLTPVLVKENGAPVIYFPDKAIRASFNPFLMEHSRLYRFIIARSFLSDKSSDKASDIFEESKQHLEQVNHFLSKKRLPFLLVILGYTKNLSAYDPGEKAIYKYIKELAARNRLRTLDLVPVFSANDPASLQQNPGDDIHFNRKGSELVARQIHGYLKKEKLLERFSRR